MAAPRFEELEGRQLLSTLTPPVGSVSRPSALTDSLVRAATAKTTTTTLAASTKFPILGQFVNLTATVKATSPTSTVPTGVVQFADGKTILGTAKLYSGGHSSMTVSNLFYGQHTITATYLGDGRFGAGKAARVAVTVRQGTMNTLPDGLQLAAVVGGTGPGAARGQALLVNYTGYLTDGTKFDTTLKPGGTPFSFYLGNTQLIHGWNEGLVGIKAGEERVLVIPSSLAFGPNGQAPVPPNATLVYIIQLVKFLAPKLVVTGGNNVPVLNNAPPTAANLTNFGSVPVGQSVDATFTVTNAGDDTLRFTYSPVFAQISGDSGGNFILAHSVFNSPSSEFTVRFTPKSVGSQTAWVTIPTNDPNFPMFSFMVVGNGV